MGVSIPTKDIWLEEGKKHPEGGKEFTDAVEKRVEEIKERSIKEKKQGYLPYRENLFWAGITSQEDFDVKRKEILEDYKNGNFFMQRIGRYREVDTPLALVLLNLREQWIIDYKIDTAPEFMLLDMALTAYFHFIRLNEDINNTMASIEWNVFELDEPHFIRNNFKTRTEGEDRAVVEEIAHKLREILLPSLDQYSRMFIRNLKAIRDLKRGNIQLNIGNVGQMNIGDKQVIT